MLRVLDVGDGACSLLWFPGGEGPVTVIDCGSYRADDAADRLADALDGRVTDIDTMIVTHFDTDHYKGFLHLANRMQATGQRFERLTLVAPTIPMIREPYAAAFQALVTTITGFRSLDLVTALSRVTKPGRFRYVTVARGWTIRVVGHTFRVHWPPTYLRPGIAHQVSRAVQMFEKLANELILRGDTRLMDNFIRARGSRWMASTSEDYDPRLWDAAFVGEWAAPDYVEYDDGPEDVEDDGIHEIPEPLDLPPDLHHQFRLAWDAFRRANNSMSLVLDEPDHRHLVVFGDVGPPIVRYLSRIDQFAKPIYAAMLAPHHGTHRLPSEFTVEAVRCVSQNGARLRDKWSNHRATHRNHNRCYTTTNIKVELGRHKPWCPDSGQITR